MTDSCERRYLNFDRTTQLYNHCASRCTPLRRISTMANKHSRAYTTVSRHSAQTPHSTHRLNENTSLLLPGPKTAMAEVSVAIYLVGDEGDLPNWCFWATDGDGDEVIFEALGSTGHAFRYHSKPVRMYTADSRKEAPRIGRIEADVWLGILDLLAGVPLRTKPGWTC
ncbi:hypothetical protein K505DRAFT_391497 [Melanomma pulvis-pyrius CBS 109.77]|uniref:Uncharacterized protein n=1 Tax=Melanomma pulvis-pyrius CBS 109.77 TaxID=1314802 RepID=A0A6A6X165_9PLEO|nr:hypothetical protein K505DRAFT_391497 [Melanomma pulvis-pyrius CBS 109.77]